MEFKRCIDNTVALTKELCNHHINGDIISLIMDYTLESRVKQYTSIENRINELYGNCTECGFPDVETRGCANSHCENDSWLCRDCAKHVIDDGIICQGCYVMVLNKKCKCTSFKIRKCYSCECVCACSSCEMINEDMCVCFSCYLDTRVPSMSCVNCKKRCLVDKYIPKQDDTKQYHPWFEDHIKECESKRLKTDK